MINLAKECKRLIDQDTSKQYTLDELVSALNTNRTTLNLRFKSMFHVTVTSYINKRRGERLIATVKGTNLTLDQLAEMFETSAYQITRLCREATGKTVKQIREAS